MSPTQTPLVAWLTLGLAVVAALVAAGRWAGGLQERVTALERHEQYLHGTVER